MLKILTADPRDSEALEREDVCCESICRVQMRRGHYIMDVGGNLCRMQRSLKIEPLCS